MTVTQLESWWLLRCRVNVTLSPVIWTEYVNIIFKMMDQSFVIHLTGMCFAPNKRKSGGNKAWFNTNNSNKLQFLEWNFYLYLVELKIEIR